MGRRKIEEEKEVKEREPVETRGGGQEEVTGRKTVLLNETVGPTSRNRVRVE